MRRSAGDGRGLGRVVRGRVPVFPVLIGLAAAADGQGLDVPPAFVENRGQADPTVRFTSSHGGVDVVCVRDGLVFCLSRREEVPSPRPEA